jgi:L-lactate dehydrogenase (cytochrome)
VGVSSPTTSARRASRALPRWSELRALIALEPLDLNRSRRLLRRAASVTDVRELAARVTPRAVFDYTDGGAGDEVSIQRSSAAFARVEFRPRVLRDVATVDTSVVLLGGTIALPIVLAPTGFTRLMHHEGEIAVARAAGAAGLPYALSTMGTTSIDALARSSPDTRRWFQLYLWKDRARTAELVAAAAANGYEALVLTVDTPVPGPRLRDARNGMTIPPRLTPRTVGDVLAHPRWWLNLLTTEPLKFASLSAWNGTVAELAQAMFDPSAGIRDLEWLRETWPGTLIVKGVQSAADAQLVVEAGANAVVVSNHGGRQLDRAPVPLEQLSAVADAVGDRAAVLVDGGVMSGADAVAAVCLGADAVMIGRAYLYGLMAGGHAGVQHVLAILADEVRRTMQLLGVAAIADLSREHARLL